MEEYFTLVIGVLSILAISGELTVMLDATLRNMNIHLNGIGLGVAVPAIIGLAVAGFEVGFEDSSFLPLFGLVFALGVWASLPGLAYLRVKRFEYALASKGVRTMDGKLARKRLSLFLPFIANPFTFYYLIKTLFARGRLTFVKPKIRRKVDARHAGSDYEENSKVYPHPWSGPLNLELDLDNLR